jgi:hypothetical protein
MQKQEIIDVLIELMLFHPQHGINHKKYFDAVSAAIKMINEAE